MDIRKFIHETIWWNVVIGLGWVVGYIILYLINNLVSGIVGTNIMLR